MRKDPFVALNNVPCPTFALIWGRGESLMLHLCCVWCYTCAVSLLVSWHALDARCFFHGPRISRWVCRSAREIRWFNDCRGSLGPFTDLCGHPRHNIIINCSEQPYLRVFLAVVDGCCHGVAMVRVQCPYTFALMLIFPSVCCRVLGSLCDPLTLGPSQSHQCSYMLPRY